MSNIVEVAKYDESSSRLECAPRPLGRALRQAVRVAMPKRLSDGSLVPGTPVGLIGRPGIGKTAALCLWYIGKRNPTYGNYPGSYRFFT